MAIRPRLGGATAPRAAPSPEDSKQLRFMDVLTSDFLGLERKHHLVPVAAVSEEDPGSITLGVDQEAGRARRLDLWRLPGAGPDGEVEIPDWWSYRAS